MKTKRATITHARTSESADIEQLLKLSEERVRDFLERYYHGGFEHKHERRSREADEFKRSDN